MFSHRSSLFLRNLHCFKATVDLVGIVEGPRELRGAFSAGVNFVMVGLSYDNISYPKCIKMIQDDQDVSNVSNLPVVADELSQFYMFYSILQTS